MTANKNKNQQRRTLEAKRALSESERRRRMGSIRKANDELGNGKDMQRVRARLLIPDTCAGFHSLIVLSVKF